MLGAVIKVALVAGAAYWILTGNRSIEMMAMYGLATLFLGYDLTMGHGLPIREKSLLDRPKFKRETSWPEKILDTILILVLVGLGIYMVKFQ